MKIYTKTGDKGETGLVDDSRINKADCRIQALGTIDEANASIGIVISYLGDHENPNAVLLRQVQGYLFACGSRLADPAKETKLPIELPGKAFVQELEQSIDTQTKQLPLLTNFILPGGTPLASHVHLARTIVRRAERIVAALKTSGEHVDEEIGIFLNRLSDWLFTYARTVNHNAGQAEHIWDTKK